MAEATLRAESAQTNTPDLSKLCEDAGLSIRRAETLAHACEEALSNFCATDPTKIILTKVGRAVDLIEMIREQLSRADQQVQDAITLDERRA